MIHAFYNLKRKGGWRPRTASHVALISHEISASTSYLLLSDIYIDPALCLHRRIQKDFRNSSNEPFSQSMTRYADLMQDILDALTRLSRHHAGPNRLIQHLGTRQCRPIGALTSLEPLEIINLVPLVFPPRVVIDSLRLESASRQSRAEGHARWVVSKKKL